MSGAMAILRLRLSTIPRSRPSSPRSRSAGRPAPRCQSHNKKFTTQLSPLPQRGRGAGGEGRPHLSPDSLPLPRCGRGRGVPPHLPPQPPFLSHAVGEEGGEGAPSPTPRPPSVPIRGEQGGDEPSSGASASFNDAASTNQISPLPQRGRGAGGEGRPHLSPDSLPLPPSERKGEA